jgi:hypothetical protein
MEGDLTRNAAGPASFLDSLESKLAGPVKSKNIPLSFGMRDMFCRNYKKPSQK